MKLIRWLFSRKRKITSVTTGQKGADGFADVFINGKHTNVRMLLFEKEDIERLHRIAEENRKNNR